MIKDPIIKIFVLSKRLWREIKKPVIRTRLAGKFSILQSREAPESNEKKAVFHTTFDLSIAKILVFFIAFKMIYRFLKLIFD